MRGGSITGVWPCCNKGVIGTSSLVPRPHLFLEVDPGLVNNEHFLGCAESACHMISIATEVRL